MRQIFTAIFLLFIGVQAFSQSYLLSPKDTAASSDDMANIGAGGVIAGHLSLTVTTSSLKITKWKKTNQIMPAGWTTSVCDLSACYGSNISSYFFEVESDTTGQITLDFFPCSSGVAVTTLHLYDSLNTADDITATFIAKVTDVNGVEEIANLKDIYLSPVPAKENLLVIYDYSLHATKSEVYNVLGQLMKSVKIINDGSSKVDINLSGLEKGLYFLRVYSADNKVLTRQFSKD